jgi:flavine halogenase
MWIIPLSNQVKSVGIVFPAKSLSKVKSNPSESSESTLLRVLSNKSGAFRTYVSNPGASYIKSRGAKLVKDFSYVVDSLAGPGYRLAGDAATFLDPMFSSGVHMAITGGFSAAATIAAEIRGHVSRENAEKYHSDLLLRQYSM